MSDVQFDAHETVGGFTLSNIKRALSWVGLMDDRDDVKTVAKALKCSRSQAERVLAALERRGFVTKEIKKNHWKKTRLGADLALRWCARAGRLRGMRTGLAMGIAPATPGSAA